MLFEALERTRRQEEAIAAQIVRMKVSVAAMEIEQARMMEIVDKLR